MRLSDLPRFQECSRREVRVVDQLATGVDIARGATLFAQGQRARELMFVGAGRFDVWHDRRQVAEATNDDVFGELSILAGANERRFTTVEAATDGYIFAMSRLDFMVLTRRVPRLAEEVLRTGLRRAVQWSSPGGHETTESSVRPGATTRQDQRSSGRHQ